MRQEKEYKALLRRLMPPGSAFWGIKIRSVLSAIAKELYNVDQYAEGLLQEIYPKTSTADGGLLADHETDLGIPDDCTDPELSFEDRQRIADSKFSKLRSMSKDGIEDFIASFGFQDYEVLDPIIYPSALCGVAICGEAVVGSGNAYYFVEIILRDSTPPAVRNTLECILRTKILKPTTDLKITYEQEPQP
jgi:uncharacterized protein YmfQ (DUF2313 family)